MIEGVWGLLGPEFLPNTRRTRTLGLGASIRRFSDLAVPGIGGVWYGKQLLLAALGVAVAEAARSQGVRVQNIEVANAIEALACWLAFKSNGWSSDSRLRGNTKLQGKDDFSFRRARQRNFYVTQPMRMATVQALHALGFVESDSARFNAFCCTEEGSNFIEQATRSYSPHKTSVIDHLTKWVLGESDKLENSLRLIQALSPLDSLSQGAIQLLRERLIQGGTESREDKKRRGNALAWVESLRTNGPDKLAGAQRPQEISEDHWHDLQAGALFFQAREAAIATLDAAEVHIGNQGAGQFLSLKHQVPDSLAQSLEKLKLVATQYLDLARVDEDATTFCQECGGDDPVSILRKLVYRDGHVLRLIGDEIKPGAAFRGSIKEVSANDEEPETPNGGRISLPEGISYRVRNLYLLNLDMHGELDEWLNPHAGGGEA